MPQRVRPVILLGLIAVLVLSIGILASARTGGGSPGDALAVGAAEVGKPYSYGTDGPGTYSCTGLMRHILRTIGVDSNAPWDHAAYLSAYPTHATPQPGDVVVYPDGVGMYVGDNTVLMANDADQVVGYYPMDSIGTPLGFANPYGGAQDSAEVAPAAPAGDAAVEPPLNGPVGVDPTISDVPVDNAVIDPTIPDPVPLEDPAVIEGTAIDPVVLDGAPIEPALPDAGVVDPGVVDPTLL